MIATRPDPRRVLAGVVRRVFDEPPPLTAAEWADQFAYFTVDRRPVKYRNSANPYARTILNLMHRPGIREVAYMKAEQVGGTTTLLMALGYVIDRRPCATLIVYPNATVAGRQNTEKIIPSVRATPVLSARLGPKSHDAKTLAINFDRMRLTMVGAPPAQKVDANVEGHSYGFVPVDEVDRCHPSIVDIVEGRGKVRDNFLLWTQGTPEFAGQGIDRRYNGADDLPPSDRGRFYLPCPHDNCRQYHVREFRHVRWPGVNKKGEESDDTRDIGADPERVRRFAWYKCPHCRQKVGAEHNLWQAERHVLLTQGRSVGPWTRGAQNEFVPGVLTGPESRSPRAGVWQGGLYTCLPADVNPYGYVAEGFVKAKGKPSQTWVNRVLGEAWSAKGDSVDVKDLKTLRVPVAAGGYKMGTVPAWALVLVSTIDVQIAHTWVSIYGVGEGGRDRCLVWFGRVPWLETTQSTALDEALDRVFTRADGVLMRSAVEFVDEGDRTDEVHARARRRRASGRLSNTVKGVGAAQELATMGPHAWSWVDRLPNGEADTRGPKRLRLNSFMWKRAAHRLMRVPGQTGATDEDELLASLGEGAEAGATSGRLWLPEDAPDEYLRQMASEQLAPVKMKGSQRVSYRFIPKPGFPDNHAFDDFVYLCAAVDAMPELRGMRAAAPVQPRVSRPAESEQRRPVRAVSPALARARERAMRRRE